MRKPRICAVIASANIKAVEASSEMADIFEVRIDLIGQGWKTLAATLRKPWIATNRLSGEGGGWIEGDARCKEELLLAIQMGAGMVDLDISTPGLAEFLQTIKGRVECIISYHNYETTPPFENLAGIVRAEIAAGADICKVATTATVFSDNLTVLRLIREFPASRLVTLAMGTTGQPSRLMGPLAGAEFTYAAIESGQQSAPGQLPFDDLYHLYRMIQHD